MHCAYYAGFSLYAQGKMAEAAVYLGQALDLSPSQARSGPARNAMLKRVAREEGACIADLDSVFRQLSPGQIPGFGQFKDDTHWLPAYNRQVWKGIFSAAESCGIKAASAYKGTRLSAEKTNDLAAQRLSYAVSWIFGEELSERTVYTLEELILTDPGLVKAATRSPDGLSGIFMKNFWSYETAASLRSLYPAFILHAAEAYRRSCRLKPAMELAENLTKTGYSNARLKLMKVKMLHALGRDKEAEVLLNELAATPEWASIAFSLNPVLGLKGPSLCAVPGALKKSRKLSDKGAVAMGRGDVTAAEKSFLAAVKHDPANTGALLSLCILNKRLGKPDSGVEYCRMAADSALCRCSGAGPGERDALAAGAFLEIGRIHIENKNPAAAAPALLKALKMAPKSWARAEEAGRLLKALTK